MQNFLPDFIRNKFINTINSGSGEAIALFMDISGFTSMTRQLMRNGKEGAEIISSIVNSVFDFIIKEIYQQNGFISAFAGDAITALFEVRGQNCQEVEVHTQICLLNISNHFRNNLKIQTKYGEYSVSLKIGLGKGTFDWRIIGSEGFFTYFMGGEAITKAMQAAYLENHDLFGNSENYPVIPKIHRTKPLAVTKLDQLQLKKILQAFLPNSLLEKEVKSEFRDIISIFIGLQNQSDTEQIICNILINLRFFKGYLNGCLDFDQKGLSMLVQFGVPYSHENPVSRALDFILSLKNLEQMKIGMAYGPIFAGKIGNKFRATYTCIGNTVNLSARLMEYADYGQILTDKNIYHYYQISNKYNLLYLQDRNFKGFEAKISVYQLLGKRNLTDLCQYPDYFMGREKELQTINSYIQIDDPFVLFVQGAPGIGKSRLLYEIKKLHFEINWINLYCDEVVKKPFQPFIRYLKQFFLQNPEVPDQENYKCFLKLFHTLTSDPNNIFLKSSERFLLGLLELNSDVDSICDLSPETQYKESQKAILSLIRAVSAQTKTVIEISDLHWMDTESLKLIKSLLKSHKSQILISTRENPLSLLENDQVKQDQIIFLSGLDTENSGKLVQLLAQNKIINEDLKNIIIRQSEGNPFYIEQIVQYLAGQGSELDSSLNTGIPDSISNTILSRIDRLSEELRELIKYSAVYGKEFNANIINLFFQNNAKLEQLLWEGQFEDLWIPLGEKVFSFKHSYVRESVYQLLSTKDLISIHKHIARHLKSEFGNKSSFYPDIAYHYLKTYQLSDPKQRKEDNLLDQTLEYLVKAAKNQAGKYLIDSFFSYCESIYQLFGFSPEKTIKLSQKTLHDSKKMNYLLNILRLNADVCINIGRLKDAYDLYKRGLEISIKIKNNDLRIEYLVENGNIQHLLGEYQKSMKTLEIAIAEIAQSKNPVLKGVAYNAMGNLHISMGNYPESISNYMNAIKFYDKHSVSYMRNIANIGMAYLNMGKIRKSEKFFQKWLEFGIKKNDKFDISNAYIMLVQVMRFRNEWELSLDYLEKALPLALEIHSQFSIAKIYGLFFDYYVHSMDYPKAFEFGLKNYRIIKEMNWDEGLACILISLPDACLKYGDLVMADQLSQEAMDFYSHYNFDNYYSCIIAQRISTLACLGHFQSALTLYNDYQTMNKEHITVDICLYLNTAFYYSQIMLDMDKEKNFKKLLTLPITGVNEYDLVDYLKRLVSLGESQFPSYRKRYLARLEKIWLRLTIISQQSRFREFLRTNFPELVNQLTIYH